MEEVPEEQAPAPVKKRGKKGLMLVIIAVVVLGVGGGGAWWMLSAAPSGTEAAPEVEHGLLVFEPFLVNLSGGPAQYLKVSLQLVVGTPEQAEEVGHSKVLLMKARSAILELLTQQTSAVLITAEGKEALKKAIQERASKALPGTKVIDVLFADFVIQF